jgi:hypothetical protein
MPIATPFPDDRDVEVVDPRWVKSWSNCNTCIDQGGWPALPSTYVWEDFQHNLQGASDDPFERYSVFYNNDCELSSTVDERSL